MNFLGFGASTGFCILETLAGGAPVCGFHGAVFTPGARAGSNLSRASLTGFCSSISISAIGTSAKKFHSDIYTRVDQKVIGLVLQLRSENP